jgi:hypothetical protein
LARVTAIAPHPFEGKFQFLAIHCSGELHRVGAIEVAAGKADYVTVHAAVSDLRRKNGSRVRAARTDYSCQLASCHREDNRPRHLSESGHLPRASGWVLRLREGKRHLADGQRHHKGDSRHTVLVQSSTHPGGTEALVLPVVLRWQGWLQAQLSMD